MFFRKEAITAKRKKLKDLIKTRQAFEAKENHAPYSTHKTDVNFCDVNGKSLLHYAIEEGDFKKVKKLVEEKNADIHLATRSSVREKTSIKLALENGNLEIAKYLYDKGADCSEILLQDVKGNECQAWFKGKIREALKKGYPVENYSLQKENQFFKKEPPKNKHGEITQYINQFQRFVEIGKPIFPDDLTIQYKPPLLNLAAANGQLEIIEILLEKSLSIDPSKKYTESAFQAAVRYSQLEVAKELLNRGADLNWQNNRKDTALMIAIENQNETIIDYLLSLNPDLSKTDIFGNTILHRTVTTGNHVILKRLLKEDIKSLSPTKNIYGQTAFDLARIKKDTNASQLLSEENVQSISEDFLSTVEINQTEILKKIFYYLTLEYRDPDLFNLSGCCNGLAYLFLYYSTKGMEDYFFDTLKLISNWDGNETTLNQDFGNIPQAKYYKNLKELFEQWTNDIIWFQHLKLENLSNLSQKQRFEQYSIIGDDINHFPQYIYSSSIPDKFTKTQIQEILFYFSQMPPGTLLEIGGGEHATSAYINEKKQIIYYDSNFRYRTVPTEKVELFFNRIIDVKYIPIEKYVSSPDQFDINFNFFYFAKDRSLINKDYKIFLEEELPKNTEEGKQFQINSPNQFTHLHITIMMRSLTSLQELLKQNYCDINAMNRFGETALELAVKYDFDEAIVALLNDPNICLKNPPEAVKFYQIGKNIALQKLIDHPNSHDLSNLLLWAISRNDLDLVTQLILKKKVNINPSDQKELPLLAALKIGNEKMIDCLLQHGAKITLIEVGLFNEKISPLSWVIKNEKYYQTIVSHLNTLDESDETGNTALHHAILHNKLHILKELLTKGADLHIKNKNNESPLDFIAKKFDLLNEKQEEEFLAICKIIFSSQQFDTNNDEDAKIFRKLFSLSISENYSKLSSFLLTKSNSNFINAYNNDGLTLLHEAIKLKNFDMLEKLIEKGGDVNLKSKTKLANTYLHSLIKANYDKSYIELFLKHGARLDIPNAEGKTAKDYLDESNNEELKEMLRHYQSHFKI